jgi:hypothetical protein
MLARRLLAVAACVAGVAVAVTACASEAEPGEGGVSAGGGGTVSGYLGQLPVVDDGETVVVTYGDIARAAEIAGLERPDDISDTEAVVDFVMEVGGQRQEEGERARAAVLLPQASQPDRSLSDLDGFVADVGWSILEVDTFAERDTLPKRVALLDGDFDGDRLDGALDDAGDGVWVAGDPDGDMHIDDTTPARPLGEPVWLALDGDRLTVTGNEGDMAGARGADGGDDTLAGDETLADLAHALDVYDAYSAQLMAGGGLGGLDPSVVLGDETPEDIADQIEELDTCTGITGVAAGVADDGRPLILLAVASASEDAAEENEAILTQALDQGRDARTGRPWSEVLDVETIGTEGSVTTVTARPADMVLGQWHQFVPDRSFPPC